MPTYLISGANRGLGLELSRQLAGSDNEVIATCRQPDRAAELGQLSVRVEALDVTEPQSVAALQQRLLEIPVHVLINNAAIGVNSRPLEDLDYDHIGNCFLTNVIGPLRLTQALLPNLQMSRPRKVINITSRMGSIASNDRGEAYGYRASKAALNMVNQSLSIDLRDRDICCVVLHPGWVRTDMGGEKAPLSVVDSVTSLLRVIDRLRLADTGKFLNCHGEKIPW